MTINYDPLNGIVDHNALRLLRRNGPQAPWQVVATELNALAKTLSAPNVSSFGEWTLGSTSAVNPLEPQPPGLVSMPNPPDGEVQVFETPRLSWLAAEAGRSYDLFLWPDTGDIPATATAANLTGPSFQVVNALPFGAKFRWQVIARNIDGVTAGPVWSFTVQTLTDLQVTTVNVPNEAFSGQAIEVSWVVTNNSTAPTDAARWFDEVYLSANPVFNSTTATSLGQFENVAFLPAGEGYTNTKQFTLPQGIIGNYYIFVATDVTKRQRESNDNNNVTRSPQPIKINLTPPPDLQVTRILSPDNAFSADRIEFSYTVTNRGTGTTGVFEWFDAIFFSKDPVLNANAQQLGSVARHVGVLDPDSSYSVRTNVIIPKGAQGPSYLFVATDVTNQVFEFALESNNVGRDSIHVTLTPPPDLVVQSVTVPASAASGDSLTVSWTVENLGPGSTTAQSISDRIYLSRTATFSADSAIVLGSLTKVMFTGNTPIVLNPGDTYDQALRVKLPDGVFGNLYIFVQTDWNNLEFEHNFEINNFTRAPNPLSIDLSPWSDLRILSIQSPDSAIAGGKITIDWTGANSGIPLDARASWVDRVFVSADSTFDSNRARLLVDATRTGPLDSTTTYTQTRTVELPVELSGKSYLYVQTDATNRIFEHVDEANNVAQSRPLHVRPYPVVDLAVTALTVPDTGFSGRAAALQWTVTNVGQGRTLSSNWVDEIYLSRDTSLEPNNDLRLESVRRSQALAAGQNYSRSFSGKLPHGIAGDFYVIVKTDVDEQVTDGNRANNLRVSATPINIVLTPAPDLQVIAVAAPTERNSGQPVTVKWIVQNTGIGVTEAAAWFDVIYLSANTTLDATDLKLASYTRNSVLQPNQSYTDSLEVDLPTYVSGAYYLLVSADNRKDIFELDEENNTGVATIFLTLPPPSDLVVTNITVPESSIPGEEVTVTYTLQNLGANPAVGFLSDAVFFSADTIWTIDDPLLGIQRRSVNIPPGGVFQAKMKVDLAKTFKMDANTGEITEELPGLTPGAYHAIVRTDIKNNIRESDEANNTSASANTLDTDVPALTLGVPTSGTLREGQMKYFRVEVGENLDLRLTLTSNVADAANEVYVAFGRTPTLSDFDFAATAPFSAKQDLLIPSTQNGTYFILILARDLPFATVAEEFSLLAEALPFSILSITPDRGGSGGRVTCMFTGAGFHDSMKVYLEISPDSLLDGKVLKAYNTTEAKIRWNLDGVPLGRYKVVAIKDNSRAVLATEFEVEPKEEMVLEYFVNAPSAIRVEFPAVYEFNFQNKSNVDIPYLRVLVIFPEYTNLVSVEATENLFTISDILSAAALDSLSLTSEEYANAYHPEGEASFRVVPLIAKNIPAEEPLKCSLKFRGFRTDRQFPVVLAYKLQNVTEFIQETTDNVDKYRMTILGNSEQYNPDLVALAKSSEDFLNWVFDGYISTGFLDPEDWGDFKTKLASKALSSNEFYEITESKADKKNMLRYRVSPQEILSHALENFDMAAIANFNEDDYWCALTWALACILIDILICGSLGIAASPVTTPLGGLVIGALCAIAVGVNCFVISFIHCNWPLLSQDPNDIVGPSGYGEHRYVTISQNLPYTIRFENDPELATASAQTVTITNQLDSTLDIRTFRLGSFGFGSFNFTVPENRSYYTQRLDVRDSLGIFVDVTAGIDVTKNEAFWIFKSIDPATGEAPTDPFAGFLPVNDSTGVGQGFVSYTIRPRADAKTRDVIDAQARIVFDINEPIDTPAIFNTIDADAPSSRVNALPAAIPTQEFTVSWTASDSGSGIQDYTLYASEGEQPLAVYQSAITDTFTTFTGEFGKTYRFFTIARDNVGNIEPLKTAGDVAVTLDSTATSVQDENAAKIPTQFALHQNYPNPFNPTTTIKYDLPKAVDVTLVIYDMLGRKVKSLIDKQQVAGFHSVDWNGRNEFNQPVGSGVYFYRLEAGGEFVQVRKLLMLK